MRLLTSLPSLLPTILALASTQTQAADACGWQPPRLVVHRVSSHAIKLADGAWTHRAFAAIGDAPQIPDWFWTPLAPGTYDAAAVAQISQAPARELTLVGPSGLRVVAADRRVAMKDDWRLGDHARTVVEVPVADRDNFQIALDGRVADAKWHAIEINYTRTATLDGTDVTITTGEGAFTAKLGTREIKGAGYVLGAVDSGGKRYIVADAGKGELTLTDLGVI